MVREKPWVKYGRQGQPSSVQTQDQAMLDYIAALWGLPPKASNEQAKLQDLQVPRGDAESQPANPNDLPPESAAGICDTGPLAEGTPVGIDSGVAADRR